LTHVNSWKGTATTLSRRAWFRLLHARDALATLLAELAPAGRVTALALRATPFGALPDDVSEVLDYATCTCVADEMLYLTGAGLTCPNSLAPPRESLV
jgi:hypothetical protein